MRADGRFLWLRPSISRLTQHPPFHRPSGCRNLLLRRPFPGQQMRMSKGGGAAAANIGSVRRCGMSHDTPVASPCRMVCLLRRRCHVCCRRCHVCYLVRLQSLSQCRIYSMYACRGSRRVTPQQTQVAALLRNCWAWHGSVVYCMSG